VHPLSPESLGRGVLSIFCGHVQESTVAELPIQAVARRLLTSRDLTAIGRA
jgi:hypothetical protein